MARLFRPSLLIQALLAGGQPAFLLMLRNPFGTDAFTGLPPTPALLKKLSGYFFLHRGIFL
ncbi:hypothetical protein DCCM_2862 [Desulfocucumis palustris]|uniref:Uncharacterized protein n=1 Tax=Desulfocucumis palustris TaxID=1898651 RepID=A0A2L2XCB7_9FIRM|nr:hypothetical protein DCCM_2862 [Desulfocucumis palustris]